MGLVDYSDSESEAEAQPSVSAKQPSKPNSKPFQKFVDRSNPGKILVNLPTSSSSGASGIQQPSDGPPAKRAKTAGGSRFSGFSSFLPPPKTTGKPPALSQSSSSNNGKGASRPAFSFKTGAEPAFSREAPAADDGAWNDDDGDGTEGGGSRLKLPPPKSHSTSSAGPSIPAEQKPADEVKLVGKPLMFKPLSVSRKSTKKKTTGGATASKPSVQPATSTVQTPAAEVPAPEPPKKKVSLFSFGDDTPATTDQETTTGAYEPLFTAETDTPAPSYDDPYPPSDHTYPTPHTNPAPTANLSSFANDMNLSKAARRELFGRDGGTANSKIVNFDMEQEYSHNESLRQAGETATHNPVRSIAPGKHSLRQLVNAVQNNASALEESFATSKSKRGEAAGRYGWR